MTPRAIRTSFALGLSGTALLLASTAFADTMLPAPYISRALDAVLLPIDNNVSSMFALSPDDTGALVLAVQPGGIAAANGILPGDVISYISGYAVYEPIDIDTIIYYWIAADAFDFYFDVYRGGEYFYYESVISYDSYYEEIEISSVESWSSYSYESFSYSEYYSEYSEEVTESYESSESYIEETVSSEEWVASFEEETEALMDEEETTGDEDTGDDSSDEAVDDEAMADDGSDEAVDDEAVADDGSDEAVDEEAVADDGSDEAMDEEDTGGDDGGDDSGGDE